MTDAVSLDITDGLATVTLNRPEAGNAIDLPLAQALMQAMHDCEQDKSIRAILIKGAGKLFCAGGDLKTIRAQGDGAPAYVHDVLVHLHEAISTIARIPVPVVAAVHGSAAGAGLSLASACDLAIAAESSRFVMAYSKVGLTPDGSATWFLPRIIGVRRSLGLALTNRPLSAAEALQWDLINEVVADAAFDHRVGELMQSLVDGPTHAFAGAKRLIRGSLQESLETQMVRESATLCEALAGDEAAEGMSAFVEKRAPRFR